MDIKKKCPKKYSKIYFNNEYSDNSMIINPRHKLVFCEGPVVT